MTEEVKQQIENLEKVSVLDMPNVIKKMELYDQKTVSDIFEEVSREFGKEDSIDNVVTPVFTTLIDSTLQLPCFKGITSRLGLSANRVMQECKDFNYDGRATYLFPDSLVEHRSQEANATAWGQENRPKYDRYSFEDKAAMNRYKKECIKAAKGRKNLKDEYTSKKNITPFKNDPDRRLNDPQIAETDHGMPLEKCFSQSKNNMGLSTDDIKRITNQDYNFALTSRKINNTKRARKNSEFIKWQEERKAQGKSYIELSEETKKNLLAMEKSAQKAINKGINATVIENLIGKGVASRKERKEAIKKKEEDKGAKLTKEELLAIDRQLARRKAAGIHKANAKQAGKQTMEYALGSAILFVFKPLYFEIKDGIIYGFMNGVNADTYKEAFAIRFQRVKDYVLEQFSSVKDLLHSSLHLLENFISAFIEGIVGMFVGIFRNILKILKEGIKAFVEIWPVLFGENSKNMSDAQKGDAILKILGGTAVVVLGTMIDQIIKSNAALIPEKLRSVVSTLLTGVASILVFYILEEADLFNVKEDKRNARIFEVLEGRKKDMEEACNALHTLVGKRYCETYRTSLINILKIRDSLSVSDYSSANDSVLSLGKVLGIEFEYDDLSSFINAKNNGQLTWNF